MMKSIDQQIENLQQELRRGVITLATLSQLSDPQYGYSLVTTLKEKGLSVEAGTLYPLLRRLEKQGLLKSEWDTTETRPRKYYYLSDIGKVVLTLLRDEWEQIVRSLDSLMKGEE